MRGKHLNKKNKFGPHLFFLIFFFYACFSFFLNGISIVVDSKGSFFFFLNFLFFVKCE